MTKTHLTNTLEALLAKAAAEVKATGKMSKATSAELDFFTETDTTDDQSPRDTEGEAFREFQGLR